MMPLGQHTLLSVNDLLFTIDALIVWCLQSVPLITLGPNVGACLANSFLETDLQVYNAGISKETGASGMEVTCVIAQV